jgi:transcriptional regulator with XRE-family HTH domain
MRTAREKKQSRAWAVHNPSDLGRAIAGLRSEKGLTQADLANRTGISRVYLARLESGASQLVLERALRALRRMGATVTVTAGSPRDDGED